MNDHDKVGRYLVKREPCQGTTPLDISPKTLNAFLVMSTNQIV